MKFEILTWLIIGGLLAWSLVLIPSPTSDLDIRFEFIYADRG